LWNNNIIAKQTFLEKIRMQCAFAAILPARNELVRLIT